MRVQGAIASHAGIFRGAGKEGITCKGIQHSLGFSILRCKFRIPGTGLRSLLVEVVFWILNVSGILDFLSCIPDYKAYDSAFHRQNFRHSGFHKQQFPVFPNPNSLTWARSVKNKGAKTKLFHS